ncbi:PAS domain-containing protein [bacterium]|nr:PAS domain-containing protein [bacterium]
MPDFRAPADILLVDDLPANLLALEAVLDGLGDHLVRASTGEEALRILAARDFAVVLLDVRLPGLSGFETASRMRATDRGRQTPVIFLTAAGDDEFPVVEAYRLGAVDYLVKPIVPEILRAKVAVFVELYRTGERLRAMERQERARADETERRFARFMAHLPGLAWIKDAAGHYLYANDAALRAFGTTAEALYGRTDDEVFPPDAAAAFRANDRLAADTGGVQTVETLTHPDGSVHHSLVSKFLIPGPAGRPPLVGGVAIDVTEQKRSEAELVRVTAESDRRRRLYETILSNTPDLAYVWGLDHRFTYANEGLLRMWGKTWDEAIGKTCSELGYPDWHAAMHGREIEQVRATKAPVRSEVPFTGTFGRRIYDYILVPVIGADGEVEAVAGTTRDVTERKEAEDALREANRRKDEFLAILAHELRNPLAPIRNAVAVLRLRPPPDQLDKLVGMMERQLGQLVHLVDDLLDVARVTSGKITLRPERLDLRGVVEAAVETARPALDAARHTLAVRLAPAPVRVDGDRTRLAQVVTNLLTNAARYTPEGGHVAVAVEAVGGDAVVSVTDSGIGIPADMLTRVFEVFAQVGQPADRSHGGLGLGLALVRSLAAMHGGAAWAESAGPGRGSTFFVRLPLNPSPSSAG